MPCGKWMQKPLCQKEKSCSINLSETKNGGLIFKLFFTGRWEWVSLAVYIAMGWLAIVAVKPMLNLLPHGLLLWIVLGGVFYTGGIVFYVWKRLPFNHAIWHLFVLGGSALHFTGILLYLAPRP